MTNYPIREGSISSRPIGPTFIHADGSVQGMGQGSPPVPDGELLGRHEAEQHRLEDQRSRLSVELNGHRRDLAKAKLVVEGGQTGAERRAAAAKIAECESLIVVCSRSLERLGVEIHGVEGRLRELRGQRADAKKDLEARRDRLIADVGRIEVDRAHALQKALSCQELADRYTAQQGSLNARTDDGAAGAQSRAAQTVATAQSGVAMHTQRAEALERDTVVLEALIDGIDAELKAMDAEPVAEGGVR